MCVGEVRVVVTASFDKLTLVSAVQFCINFANERLQSFFNFHVIKSEQLEYQREAVYWIPIKIPGVYRMMHTCRGWGGWCRARISLFVFHTAHRQRRRD